MPTVEPVLAAPRGSMPNPPGLIRLMNLLLVKFPGTHSGGWFNPASRLSGGGFSPHTVTTAGDIMCDEDVAPRIIRYLVTIADQINLQQCIAWHEIITASRWAQGIRRYAPDDHSFGNGHAHIAIGLHAAQSFDPSWVGTPDQPQMTAAQLAAVVAELHRIDNARKDSPSMPKQVLFNGHSQVFQVTPDKRLRRDWWSGTKWVHDYPAEVTLSSARFTVGQTLDVKTHESGQSENPIDIYAQGSLGEYVHVYWTGTQWATEVFA